MFKVILFVMLATVTLPFLLHTVVRAIRHFWKFPMPDFLANLIDNPLRRKIQPPDKMPARHGIFFGMRVLEIGPGNGAYTVATARTVGETGRVVAVDIEPKMIARLRRRVLAEKAANIDALVADACALPFSGASFDAIYMIAVIGEMPAPLLAMQAFQRVLKPAGTLAFSELVLDPDWPRPETLMRLGRIANFGHKQTVGGILSYTLLLEKGVASED